MAGTPEEKSRGAFFTPGPIADYLARWSIRQDTDRVLEPSCGEAVFLAAAGKALRTHGGDRLFWNDQLFGVEIHSASVKRATEALAASGFAATIENADFFTFVPDQPYDVILGNPPYIRYQDFSGAARARSMEAALAQGVRLSGLASSWAAFVVTASCHLAPDGRLGLVLPAELLSVGYAAEVRRFLLNRFKSVKLITFEERVFPGVLEDVVLLLAEGRGGAHHFELYQARNADTLAADTATWQRFEPETGGKWTPALLARESFTAYEALSAECETLSAWGRTYLGSVTGNNGYFSVSATDAASNGFSQSDLLKISPPGSRHLRGLEFNTKTWSAQVRDGAQGYLFYPAENPSDAALTYICAGEAKGVHRAYKCRVRAPWWRVPLVEVPDLFLTYMSHDRPRLIANKARTHILNSLYGIKLGDERRKIGMELLPLACLNSMTLLGAEVVGRSYGGGLLKLEPREADKLPVPSLHVIEAMAEPLRLKKVQLATALRQGNLLAAARLVDPILFPNVPDQTLEALRSAREVLFLRRKARGSNG